MSGQEDGINGMDERDQGNALRLAANPHHAVSPGTNYTPTMISVHQMKQGNMITLGQPYLRYNSEEAKSVSVFPHPPSQYENTSQCLHAGYMNNSESNRYHNHQKVYKEHTLSQLDQELDMTLKEMSRKKPPVAPRKPYRDLDLSDSSSDQESRPKVSSIMAKVSKFEYYAKQQKSVGRSQFYTSNENDISPKVFSSNSLTVNTPAKDVLGGKNLPNYIKTKQDQKVIFVNENNALDPKNCSYANVAVRNRTRIDDIVRNFDENSRNDFNKLPKKINNDQINVDNIYGKINAEKSNLDAKKNDTFLNNVAIKNNDHNEAFLNNVASRNEAHDGKNYDVYGKISDRAVKKHPLPSPSFDRNPQYNPVYTNLNYERSMDAESMRIKAYQNRIKEEEQKEAETARLEEILNMCAEYEKQITSGVPNTPTEKRSHNKIITNGSLPRSGAHNNPNFVQTGDGYYKFDTSHSHKNAMSQSLPIQRNVSSYENFDITQSPTTFDQITPEVTIRNQSNYENIGRMDELGIPVLDDKNELSSPIMLRKLYNENPKLPLLTSPVGSPYENLYYNRNLKPKSPNTQSPRTRIKTTFAHKNLPSPQYFVFPTPPPNDNKPSFSPPIDKAANFSINQQSLNNDSEKTNNVENIDNSKFGGIEKQLSLEEEIPMIDDADVTNELECRHANTADKNELTKVDSPKESILDEVFLSKDARQDKTKEIEKEIVKNQSFEDVKKELMADIPELEEFEQDLKENKREKIMKNITEDIKKMDIERDSLASSVLDESINELKSKYDTLKEDRKKLLTDIHEIKCKMAEIRSQEEDILRELEMEKALIKGEYDSEIAILNIEQKKKMDLINKAKKIEEDMRRMKDRQESRQNEMRDRVEIATMKVERIEKDIKDHVATMEELQNAQDILDNESKIFEDLEFQHLEEESELLSNREDLQNEIMRLTKKIDDQKTRILTLKSEANNNLTSALDETKILQAEYVRLLNEVEKLTEKLQAIEKELKPVVNKLNEIERTQSPDSAFYTDQTRAKSGEFGYSPQSSDSDDIELTKITHFEDHNKQIKDKFNSIDQMSQSMIVDIERRVTNDVDDSFSESPSKSSTSSKEKKGFWERNFDSLKRKSKEKKLKSPDKVDIMSQSLNENMFYNNETIENDSPFDRFNSLRNSKNKKNKDNGPIKSNSSSKIPTFAALGKIIKKDSFGKKSRENSIKNDSDNENGSVNRTRYVKNAKPVTTDNKYAKAKSSTPDKADKENSIIKEETYEDLTNENKILDNNVSIGSFRKLSKDNIKILQRKSCGDEPNMRSDIKKIADSGKIPSQDDIDRISKVTIDAPILSSDTDMNSLGKKTLDSFKEIERKRKEMLEEQGCQVIENEREKISELKRRVQDETKKLWNQKHKSDQSKSFDSDRYAVTVGHDSYNRVLPDRSLEDSSLVDESFLMSSSMFEDISGFTSSSIEELQVRHSRTESTEDERRSDDSRPLSNASDTSRDILSLPPRRRIAPYSESQRPLTRYLPVERDDFDLRTHVQSAGHQLELCPYVSVTSSSCRGYLHKLGAKFHTWSKRWFVFDRESKTFVYYWDKSEKKPRGGAYFQVIEEVYLDHGNTSKSPSPESTFIVKTRQRRYCLMATSGAAARVWIDVIFTGAQGYMHYLD